MNDVRAANPNAPDTRDTRSVGELTKTIREAQETIEQSLDRLANPSSISK